MRNRVLVLAAMALVVILAAGTVPAAAQQRIIYTHPGERVDYTGAVDGWTGSWAQRGLESTRSLITGPLRDNARHWRAAEGYPDPYYGTGVSPRYAPYGGGYYGSECYSGPDCGPYIWGRRYGWDDARYTYGGRYGSRRRGYHHQATQNNVNAWGAVNLGATVLSTVISERRADKRHRQELAAIREAQERQEEQVADGFAEVTDAIDARYDRRRDIRAETPKGTAAVNATSECIKINGQALDPGESVRVDDPANIVIVTEKKSVCKAAATIDNGIVVITCR